MDDNRSMVAQSLSLTGYSTAIDAPTTYTMTDSEKGTQNLNPAGLLADDSHPLPQNSNPGDDNPYAQSTSYNAAQVANGCVTGDSMVDEISSVATDNLTHHEADSSVHAHIVNYDSVNGVPNDIVDYHSSVVEYGGAADVSDAHTEAQHFIEVYSLEEERLWDAIRVNCLDFNSWTALIEETEKVAEANILKIRKVYDAFLAEFPLCFGYWKKYADHEARLHSANKVLEVYERAILAVTYSVDIWLHYCVFAISIYEDPDIIRRLFERGLAYVGTDYLSYPLWDEYIRYEESQQAWSNLAMIYTRILEHPIQQLDRYFNCFKDLAASRALSEIRTPEEAALLASVSVESDAEGAHGEVVKLYERCLIACANYPEYWIRYVLCMEASGSMELAINALARATQVFVKKQPEIHLFAARFKERSGDILGARSQYELLYSEISPGLLEAIQKHVNMEYRLGNKEDALSIFEKAIAAEQEKEPSQILPMLFILYSRFLYLVSGNAEKARDVFSGVLENTQLSKPLLEATIHLESILPFPKRIDYVDMLVENFITPNAENCYIDSTTDREDISCTFLEFLDLFGDSHSIKKAEDRHTLLFLRQKSTSVSKKRRADDFLSSDKAKAAKGAPLPGQSVMGAYPNSQNQWPAGYGQKAPSWPQGTPQAQGQAWNQGYPSQAGYSAYNYASYGQLPGPSSVPQSTPHGTYAPSYPTQAYTQQTFAQPAATAISSAAGFPQQPAAAVQPYYASSYY